MSMMEDVRKWRGGGLDHEYDQAVPVNKLYRTSDRFLRNSKLHFILSTSLT